MKFLYADTQDYVDPTYDFINDRHTPGREPYWGDQYAHELMKPTPYDGLLISMSGVKQATGIPASKVHYSNAEQQRMLRNGIRKFLRLNGTQFEHHMVMGDCGAFAYVGHDTPAFAPDEVVDFYSDGGFTHGVSPDHIIFDCHEENPGRSEVNKSVLDRYDVTLKNAEEFLRLSRSEGLPFEPMGAVQGWSPRSMSEAAKNLEAMGYKYLAIGGLVPLKVDVIHTILKQLRSAIKPETNIHLLGFAKADHIQDFTGYGITSFDSTSPLIKAFKDEKNNYFLPNDKGGLDYYTAIRIPQAMQNTRLMQGIKRGIFSAEDIQQKEQKALNNLRLYDQGKCTSRQTLDAVMEYHRFLVIGDEKTSHNHEKILEITRARVSRTIDEAPWKKCSCDICKSVGVEVIIFRSSNRNRRRGFHNLGVYHQHLHDKLGRVQ
jgi:hypothetical protein